MAQQQVAGGLASLAQYTVDSDVSSDEEDNANKDGQLKCKDFGDLYIKQEPADVVEEWSIDISGARDPTDEAPEFTDLQEIKVEIESEEESDSSDSSSSSSDSEGEKLTINVRPNNDDEFVAPNNGPPKTKNELLTKDLPPVEELTMTVGENECQELGEVSSTVDDLVVIESHPGMPAVDLESILFLEKGSQPLGRVFDVIGPVTRPYYVVRFNNEEHIKERGIVKGMKVYYAPKTEHTTFVFLEQLMKMKISDASWKDDEEPPIQFLDYSDDEEESRAKKEIKFQKMAERGVDESVIMAKKAKMEEKRMNRNRGEGSISRGRGRTRGGGNNGGQPSYCNSMYTAQTNPFYRTDKTYDPRQSQISWGSYNPSQYYNYGQYQMPTNVSSQYMSPQSSYVAPPTYTAASYTSQQALAGASWHNQYQQLASNISGLQQAPPPPPSYPFSQPPPPLSQPPPPPPGTE